MSVGKKTKTWKREVAMIMLFFLMYLAYLSNLGALEILVWPFMFFVTAAFGVEGFTTQILPAMRQPNNEDR